MTKGNTNLIEYIGSDDKTNWGKERIINQDMF